MTETIVTEGKRGERGHRLTCRAELARGGPPGDRGLSADRGLEKAPFVEPPEA